MPTLNPVSGNFPERFNTPLSPGNVAIDNSATHLLPDADYTFLAGGLNDNLTFATSVPLTAARAVVLPDVTRMRSGSVVTVVDAAGRCDDTFTLTVAARTDLSQTINGDTGGPYVIDAAYGTLRFLATSLHWTLLP